MTYNFRSMDGKPVLANDKEAWQYANRKWIEIDSTDALMNAAVLSERNFKERFGDLPQLPSTAFQD